MSEQEQKNVEKLIAEYQPKIKSFINKRVNNKEDAEDILQDVFYQFIKTCNIALNPIEHVSAWLYRVARNTIINHNNKKREETLPHYVNDDGIVLHDISEILLTDSPETEYLRSLVWDTVQDALEHLPAEQRTVFELTEFDNIPVKEIAKTMGVSTNTVLSRKHYAVIYLRKCMRQLYEDIILS